MASQTLDLATAEELYATPGGEPEAVDHCTQTGESCPGDCEGSCNPPESIAGVVDETPQPAAAAPPAGDHTTAIADFHHRLAEANADLGRAAIRMAKTKREAKSAADDFKDALSMLEAIARRGPVCGDDPDPTNNPQEFPEASSAAAASALGPAGPEASWRNVPLSALCLNTIKGLGEKILEALADQCPTISDLEALRAQGFGKGIGLRSIPRLGEEKAQAIEDRLLEWLSKNRDAGLFQKEQHRAQQEEAAQQDESAPTGVGDDASAAHTPKALSAGDETGDIESRPADLEDRLEAAFESAGAEDAADDSSPAGEAAEAAEASGLTPKEISARIKFLKQKEHAGEDWMLPHGVNTEAWDQGQEAFYDEVARVNVPHLLGTIQADDWLRGYEKARADGKANDLGHNPKKAKKTA